MPHSKLLSLAVIASMLAACTEADGSPGRGVMHGGALSKSDIGTAAGVIGGGVIGSTIGSGAGQVAATIGGALLGGILGDAIGSNMDDNDRDTYDRASQNAMETGRSKSWKNSRSGNYGTIHPRKRYRNDEGQYCREYTQTITVDGQKHSGHGTACREEDGTWRIVD
jgi:surface antigen